MPTTLPAAFDDFHGRLIPPASASEAARKHRQSIKGCMEANFAIRNFFSSGSFHSGTSVRGYSDADYFASIGASGQRDKSDAMLRAVRTALDARFPNTGVCIRTPAVKVPFGTDGSESTEVVPAYYVEESKGYRVYKIADGSGGWIKSSPQSHAAYVTGENDRLGKKVKPLVRFLKAWKYYRDVPIKSIYLELRATKYCSGEKVIVYSIDLRKILHELLDGGLAALQDPMGLTGYIYPCATQAQKEDALSKLKTAVGRADNAWDAETRNKIEDAFYYWGQLFGKNFPAYG